MKIFFIRNEKCCFYQYNVSLEYEYITKYLILSELHLYSERELFGGNILTKVTIL